ncbi:aminotransferase class III-fold pyridoxal phosphate-dependent enzyme [Taklimakanibacter lacteus]|uniref:aminotransferase class III-fold pyridoxal phosphate-dependent enzyme n=1 Tax=Taklimakanibacter lacteus TaxID=2268456 RepID=UPI000E66690F
MTGPSRFEQATNEMLAKTRKCQAMTGDRESILFSGMRANLHLPHPIYIASGEGATLTDIDGNTYIDTCMGFGVCVLGHRHPDIAASMARISGSGWHFGIHSQEQLPLARLLQDAVPCAERILFCNSGSEATSYAMRAARAFTGKEKIGIFDGYWHGMHDYCMVAPTNVSSRDRPAGVEISTGVPKAIRDLTVALPYRNRCAFDIIRENKDELAMVIIEPVQHSNPQRDVRDWLLELQQVCRDCNVLFCLDEMVTGFRLAYGGGQEYFGITPDLATLGKACGGGLPIGVIAGREDFMRMFLPRTGEQGVFTGGTFTGKSADHGGRHGCRHLLQGASGDLCRHGGAGRPPDGEVQRVCRAKQHGGADGQYRLDVPHLLPERAGRVELRHRRKAPRAGAPGLPDARPQPGRSDFGRQSLLSLSRPYGCGRRPDDRGVRGVAGAGSRGWVVLKVSAESCWRDRVDI